MTFVVRIGTETVYCVTVCSVTWMYNQHFQYINKHPYFKEIYERWKHSSKAYSYTLKEHWTSSTNMAAMTSKFNFECVIQYYTNQWFDYLTGDLCGWRGCIIIISIELIVKQYACFGATLFDVVNNQQYCSALLHPIAGWFRLRNIVQYCWQRGTVLPPQHSWITLSHVRLDWESKLQQS